MIQGLYKKEHLEKYIPNLSQRYINFRCYKYKGEKACTDFCTFSCTRKFTCQYLRQDGSLLSNTSINRSMKMAIIDKIDYVSENSSENYEEIINKLMELLIYLKQEVVYYEN
jgi:hypothetical protein